MIKKSDYWMPGGRSGVLLIHGLTGTPAEMRFVATGLHQQGFTVYGMQLAGHCGSVEDLLRTGWPSAASGGRARAHLQLPLALAQSARACGNSRRQRRGPSGMR